MLLQRAVVCCDTVQYPVNPPFELPTGVGGLYPLPYRKEAVNIGGNVGGTAELFRPMIDEWLFFSRNRPAAINIYSGGV